jgi:hypothetical protein
MEGGAGVARKKRLAVGERRQRGAEQEMGERELRGETDPCDHEITALHTS